MSELEIYLFAAYLLLGTIYVCLIAIYSESNPLITALGMFAAFSYGPFLTLTVLVLAVPLTIVVGPFYVLAKLVSRIKKT